MNYFLGSLLNQKGEKEGTPYKEPQTIWSYCNNKDQYLLKNRHTRFKVMERENSIREQMEKQICEIQMNTVLADSTLTV